MSCRHIPNVWSMEAACVLSWASLSQVAILPKSGCLYRTGPRLNSIQISVLATYIVLQVCHVTNILLDYQGPKYHPLTTEYKNHKSLNLSMDNTHCVALSFITNISFYNNMYDDNACYWRWKMQSWIYLASFPGSSIQCVTHSWEEHGNEAKPANNRRRLCIVCVQKSSALKSSSTGMNTECRTFPPTALEKWPLPVKGWKPCLGTILLKQFSIFQKTSRKSWWEGQLRGLVWGIWGWC